MTKTHIVETVEEFNTDGKLVRKVTTETTEENDAKDHWYPYSVPSWTVANPPDVKCVPDVVCVGNGTADSVPAYTTTYGSSVTK